MNLKNDTLSRATSALIALARRRAMSEEMERELPNMGGLAYSNGPAEQIAREHGFKHADHLLAQIEARTSARWVHFSGLTQFASEDDYEGSTIHGRTANR